VRTGAIIRAVSHVVTRPQPPFSACGGALEVHQVPVWQDNLSWIAVCTATGEAAVVDGPEAVPVLEYAKAHDLNLHTIFNTHTHGDHVGINAKLAKAGMLDQWRVVGAASTREAVPGISEEVAEGSPVRLGEVEGYVMETPGHIDGHISFVFGDVVFCGDTLFGAGCGYLFDGPPKTMYESLTRLAALDGGTRVCCAHEYTQDNLRFAWSVEPENAALAQRIRDAWAIRAEGGCTIPSTIELERATNPFLRTDSADLRRHVAAAMPDRSLDTPADVFAATRALKDRKDYRAMEDSELPLSGKTEATGGS
jgi:hydroxyacylglutathione hydrolase